MDEMPHPAGTNTDAYEHTTFNANANAIGANPDTFTATLAHAAAAEYAGTHTDPDLAPFAYADTYADLYTNTYLAAYTAAIAYSNAALTYEPTHEPA